MAPEMGLGGQRDTRDDLWRQVLDAGQVDVMVAEHINYCPRELDVDIVILQTAALTLGWTANFTPQRADVGEVVQENQREASRGSGLGESIRAPARKPLSDFGLW